MKLCAGVWLGLFLWGVRGSLEDPQTEEPTHLNETFFISEIFDKYGNSNIMTYEGFEHLLENLGLGKLKFETKHDVSLHKVNGTFREFHDELLLHKHEHSGGRTNGSERGGDERSRRERRNLGAEVTEREAEKLRRKCLTVEDILKTYGLQPYHEVLISPAKYLEMCPAIVYELDRKLCEADDVEEEGRATEEERRLVWLYASLSVLAMGVSGMACVLLVPWIMKEGCSGLLQFLVSLGVGTLCGDAVIHLMPQVFCIVGNPELEAMAFSKGTVTLLAIYFFFIVESVLKGVRGKEEAKGREESGAMIPLQGTEHGHSHGVDGIRTVAWMAIMGDVLHNVTDGLSIGATFGVRLSSGFATSIAIFCHELPHELGDYGILLASGMSVKKSLLCNVVSSVFSFVGMVAGILLGEFKNATLWINAFTAGSFLYIALSDLVPEMKAMQNHASCKSFIMQAVGLACGGILMFAIALYENQLESLLS